MWNSIFMILGKKTLIANNNSSKAFYFSSSPLPPLLFHSAAVFWWIESLLFSALSLVSRPVLSPHLPSTFSPSLCSAFFQAVFSGVFFLEVFYLCASLPPPALNSGSVKKKNNKPLLSWFLIIIFYVWYRIWSISLSEQGPLAVPKGEFQLVFAKAGVLQGFVLFRCCC